MILVKVIVNNKLVYDSKAEVVYVNTIDKGIMALEENCPNYVLKIKDSVNIILQNHNKQNHIHR